MNRNVRLKHSSPQTDCTQNHAHNRARYLTSVTNDARCIMLERIMYLYTRKLAISVDEIHERYTVWITRYLIDFGQQGTTYYTFLSVYMCTIRIVHCNFSFGFVTATIEYIIVCHGYNHTAFENNTDCWKYL